MNKLAELARTHNALERIDKRPFQRKARILQALWCQQCGYPIGTHLDRPLGSTLAMPWAKDTLANFLTDEIRQVVRQEVLDPVRSQGKLYGKPRIFSNLLSSQPLAFNLFAPLSRHLDLATAVFRKLSADRCHNVTGIEFEHSPGRGDLRFTGDSSAFDVYVTFTDAAGRPGFVGIEVKYHEDLAGEPARHRDRYDAVAAEMDCFTQAGLSQVRQMPLQQIWRDHLLAGSLLLAGGFADGFFVFLSPAGNDACQEAVRSYVSCLTNAESFQHWTLEDVAAAVMEQRADEWTRRFMDRYLAFEKVDGLLSHCV